MNLVSSTNTNTNTNIGIGSSLFEIKIKINTTFVFKPSFFSLSSSSLKFKCPSSSSFHLRLPSSSKRTMPPTNDDTFAEEEEDDQDEDIFVPLSKMRQWSRNKPRGFGEGKVYDTSLEDNLLQQLDAAANPIPNSPKPKPKPKQGGEVVPNGVIRVRLFNLPKKKNIHRDLQAAFKGFPGIINILPAVSGNLKTRDPLCKGFAFLHFNSHNQANRFVDMVSTQPITFGKVQKQIRCEIMKQPSVEIIETPLPVLNATTAPVTETPLDPSVQHDLVSPTHDDFGQLIEEKNEAHEVTSEKQKMVTLTEKGKKKTTRPSKKKVENTPKLNIPPGSANRLKMKEKALLSGVFSKYGGRQSSD